MGRKATNGRIDPCVLTLVPTHSAENAEWMGHPLTRAGRCSFLGGVYSWVQEYASFFAGGWQR
jgi:hypothetical protein